MKQRARLVIASIFASLPFSFVALIAISVSVSAGAAGPENPPEGNSGHPTEHPTEHPVEHSATSGVDRSADHPAEFKSESGSIAGPNGENGLGSSGMPNSGILIMRREDQENAPHVSPFGIDFFTEIDGYPQAFKNQTSTAGLFQYLAHLRYALSDSVTVYLRPQWTTTYNASTGAPGTAPSRAVTQVGDSIFGVIDTGLAHWQQGGSLTGIGRFYAPTGEASRNIGQDGMFYGRLIAAQPIGKGVTLLAHTIGSYYLQSNQVSLNQKGQYVGNLAGEVTPFTSVTVNLRKHLDFTQSLGLDYIWNHGARNVGVAPQAITKGYIDTSFATDVVNHLTISVGANNEPTLNSGSRVEAFRDSDYYLYTMIYATL